MYYGVIVIMVIYIYYGVIVCYGDLVSPPAAGLLGKELSLHILVGIDPLDGSGLDGCGLDGNGLDGSDLSGNDLSGNDLSGNDLSGNDLSGSDLDGSDLIIKLSQKLEAIFDLLS